MHLNSLLLYYYYIIICVNHAFSKSCYFPNQGHKFNTISTEVAPSYISELINICVQSRQLRSANKRLLNVPRTLSSHGDWDFFVFLHQDLKLTS